MCAVSKLSCLWIAGCFCPTLTTPKLLPFPNLDNNKLDNLSYFVSLIGFIYPDFLSDAEQLTIIRSI